MRADRLISLLLLLQNYGRLTARELAEKLEVSERTIHRDMEALSAAGVPVFAERGAAGGWALTGGYRTNLTGMKLEELLALLVAPSSALLGDLGLEGNYETAFQKLLAASPAQMRSAAEEVRERIHIDGAGWHQGAEQAPLLPLIQEAVWAQRAVRITYRKETEQVQRVIHPLGLVAKRSTWYAAAEAEGELRTYRISRIVDARLLDEVFDRPAGFHLAAYWEQSTAQFKASLPVYPAVLLCDRRLLPRIEREPYVQLIACRSADGDDVEAEVRFHTLESALELVLSFGALAEVAAPEQLRNAVLSELEALRQRYLR
ncbi:helix-turn-helix transcriptional regulator [Paenibacillus sp. y28]|uniref:helix-turn-helix transcriptional regulator n=1 Tax=Paenibacillus sp. y28 TaxID=3129110 RepID=UPI003016A8C0